ncbi:MAG: N-formylglutamate amidohydrolase [Candidatus Woesearchaeota archaeon]
MNYFEYKNNFSPITFSAPHGSNLYPNKKISLEPGDRGTKELTIKISKIMNSNYITSNVSRTYIDFNRNKEECILKKFGNKYYNQKIKCIEKNKRINIHKQYFETLKLLCNKYHFSIHSMHEYGQEGSVDENEKRKQIVISDLNGKSFEKKNLEKVKKEFEKEGFSVSYNYPFKGGYEIQYSKKYCSSLQIEIRKDLLLSSSKKDDKQNLFIDIKKIDILAKKISKILKVLNV